jgi:hypothetical protein
MRVLSTSVMTIVLVATAHAAAPTFPMRGDALPVFVPKGMDVEVQLAADFNLDGKPDVAAVIRGEDERYLLVALREGKGLRRVGLAELDAYPLGSAGLSAPKGVLVIEDLTGGTSAASSLYRYRYDAAIDRMRLIGDDVMYYSRTNQHGSIKISTNRLTGKRISTESKLGKDAYIPQKPKTSQVATAPLYMESASVAEGAFTRSARGRVRHCGFDSAGDAAWPRLKEPLAFPARIRRRPNVPPRTSRACASASGRCATCRRSCTRSGRPAAH